MGLKLGFFYVAVKHLPGRSRRQLYEEHLRSPAFLGACFLGPFKGGYRYKARLKGIWI